LTKKEAKQKNFKNKHLTTDIHWDHHQGNLPLPIVQYPRLYGTFIAYSKKINQMLI